MVHNLVTLSVYAVQLAVYSSHFLFFSYRTPRVKCLVIIEDQIHALHTEGYKEGVRIIPFQEVINLGECGNFAMLVSSSVSDPDSLIQGGRQDHPLPGSH
jgi:hypothetical protein